MAAALRLSRRNAGLTSTNPSVGTLDRPRLPRPGRSSSAAASPRSAAVPMPRRRRWPKPARSPAAPPPTSPWSPAPITAAPRPAPRRWWRPASPASSARPATRRAGGRQGLCDAAARRARRHRARARRRSGRPAGRLPDSLAQETAGSDSEACAFPERHDRPARRRASRGDRSGGAPAGASAARPLRCHPGRHRHGAGRRPRADGPPARPRSALADPHRARPAGPPVARLAPCHERPRGAGAGGCRRRCRSGRPPGAGGRGRPLPGHRALRRPHRAAGAPGGPRRSGASRRVLVEGGAETARGFLDEGLVDRIVLFEGPGTLDAPAVASPLDRDRIPAWLRPAARRALRAGPLPGMGEGL